MYKDMTDRENTLFGKTVQFMKKLGFELRQAGGGLLGLPSHATASFCIDLDNGREMIVSSLGTPYAPTSMSEPVGVEFWLSQWDGQVHQPEEGFTVTNVRELAAVVGEGKKYSPIS